MSLGTLINNSSYAQFYSRLKVMYPLLWNPTTTIEPKKATVEGCAGKVPFYLPLRI